MRARLIDTGPIVAYVDASDPAHRRVVETLDGFSGRLYMTAAVVTEAMNVQSRTRLTGRRPSAPRHTG